MASESSNEFSFSPGQGEMACRARSFDLGATPLGPPSTWLESLRLVLREVTHLTALVDDLLDVSRVVADAMEQVDRETASAAGFDHHFLKPLDSAKVIARLSEIAAKPAIRTP